MNGAGIDVAYAEWLGQNHWDHFATLTFEYPTSIDTAYHQTEARFLRDLGRRAGRSINYYGTIETGPVERRTHVHLVPEGTEALLCKTIADAWQCGHATVNVF